MGNFQVTKTYENIPVPKCWQDFEMATHAGIDRVILYGPPGTGKTFGGLTMGLSEGTQSYRLVCTEDMTSADVSGSWMPNKDGGFSYLLGSAAKAWKNGGRLVIDEIDKASGDVSALLLSFTDTVESASFDLPTGERIVPKEGFSVVMTSNIEHPDELPIALKDRFPVAIKIGAPHPAALMAIPEQLRMVAATVVASPPGQRASLRAFGAFVKLAQTCEVEKAAKMVFHDALASQIIDAMRAGSLNTSATLTV